MHAVSLDEISNAHTRVRRSILRGMEDAADFNDGARFSALERDQIIVDAAFFVLIFGQIERRITELAVRKVNRAEERSALRDAKFERRLEIALRDDRVLRDEIADWYSIRNAPAHGQGIASGYEIGKVLLTARVIDALLASLQ
jgi:hypothetical protein